MYPPVPSELVFSVELPPAEIARVGPLTRVDHGMAGEVVLLRERLPADFTMKGLLP